MYEFEFDKDDNVPGRERVLPASEKRAVLRKKLENDLGQIEFAAAHRILLDRYKRFERGEETPNDEEVVVQARMRKVRNLFLLCSFLVLRNCKLLISFNFCPFFYISFSSASWKSGRYVPTN